MQANATHRHLRPWTVAVALVLSLLLLGRIAPAHAAGILVNSAADDIDPFDGE